MAEGSSGEGETVNCTILAADDGSVYCFSDESLAAHRVGDDVADSLRAAYETGEAEVHGFAAMPEPPKVGPSIGSFQVLARGPVTRRSVQTTPTLDTWFDSHY